MAQFIAGAAVNDEMVELLRPVRRTKERILSLAPARWSELKEELGVSDPCLYRHLKSL